MKKFLKWFLGITAVGTVVGLVIAYFCRDIGYEECEEDEGDEDESFELDKDLKPARDREYVPLKRNEENTSEKEVAEPDKSVAEEKDEAEEEKKPEEEKPE